MQGCHGRSCSLPLSPAAPSIVCWKPQNPIYVCSLSAYGTAVLQVKLSDLCTVLEGMLLISLFYWSVGHIHELHATINVPTVREQWVLR